MLTRSLRLCIPLLAALVLLAGCGKQETPATESAAPSATPLPISKSATPNSFSDVTAQLDAGGDLYFYLNTAQWLAHLTEGMDNLHDLVLSGSAGLQVTDQQQAEKTYALLRDLVFKSGIEQVSGVGASSIAISPGMYRNKFFVHHYPGEQSGIFWSIQGLAPHPLHGLDMLPADTALGVVRDLDLAQLINFLRTEVRTSGVPEAQDAVDQWTTSFAGITGLKLDDVLNSLDGRLGLILTLDATSSVTLPVPSQIAIPAPRLALLIGVKNDLIFRQIDTMAGVNPGVIKVDDPDLKMRTMPLPMLPALNLRPTVAQWNGYLVVASDDQLVRDMISAQKNGNGFKSTPEFTALASGMPDQGNGFAVIAQRFADTLRQVQSEAMSAQPGVNANQSAFVRQVFARYQKTGHFYYVGQALPNGLLGLSQGSQGSSAFVAPLIVAPAALIASLSVPAAEAAQHRAVDAESLAREKQILQACRQFAGDNSGNLPASLDDLVPNYLSDRATLSSPLDPSEPDGYVYTPGIHAGDPGDSVVLADRFAPSMHRMQIVVYLNGSGRIIRLR